MRPVSPVPAKIMAMIPNMNRHQHATNKQGPMPILKLYLDYANCFLICIFVTLLDLINNALSGLTSKINFCLKREQRNSQTECRGDTHSLENPNYIMKETNHGNHQRERQCKNADCYDISRRFLPHTLAASNGKIADNEDHIANYVEYHC